MILSSEYPGSTESLSEHLSTGLPFHLGVIDDPPSGRNLSHRKVILHHEIMNAQVLIPLLNIELALVTPQAREAGYKSGINRIHIDPNFYGLNIASILVRNVMPLFQANGDEDIVCNTEKLGAHFWQNLGWLATEQGTTIKDAFGGERHFMGWPELVSAIVSRAHNTLKTDESQQEIINAALALLDETDSASIWNFIDANTQIDIFDNTSTHGKRAINLPWEVLCGLEVSTNLDLNSPIQAERSHQKTSNLSFDEEDYRQRLSQQYQQTQSRRLRR